jgi:uncharacterized protein YjbJ (UPF0337 family)
VLLAKAYDDGTLELLTAAWEWFLGYARHEFEGKTLRELTGCGEDAGARMVVAILDDEAGMAPVDLTLRSRTGEEKPLRLHRRRDPHTGRIFILAEEDPAPPVRVATQTFPAPGPKLGATKRNRPMNWDRIEGNWKQFKGNALQQWGKLTHDQLDVIAGKRDVLLGKIQEAYGISKDEGMKQLEEWEKRMRVIGVSNETTVGPAAK